jgi:uncharacterized membrane protein
MVLYYIFSDKEKAQYTSRQEPSSAEDILKMRYIKGEINEETFEKMKKMISK